MTTRHSTILAPMVALGLSVTVALDAQAIIIRSATGANAAAIQAAVDAFRADLGTNNGLGPCVGGCVPGVGRREINWDAVPDAFSSGGANAFPGNFFNLPGGSPAGRVRGAQFSTTGGFEVSANAASGVPILFGNHSPDNADDFAAFSAERIFGLVGTNEMSVSFSVPGTPGAAATTRGFGAIFTDVELAGSTNLKFFDINGNLLHSEDVSPFVFTTPDSFKSFSFLGVSFDDPIVARVDIVNGGFDLDLIQFGASDAVAMDDFIYGEPIAAA
ncbi:MAG: hypothetical protein FJX57_04660, partial [Alphaproteobacteria bacterium]|nr:hypothetical protein [Alphaproteobacteria bacterium]